MVQVNIERGSLNLTFSIDSPVYWKVYHGSVHPRDAIY
jgi:hypothetical protein